MASDTLTLYDLNKKIQSVTTKAFPDPLWVMAEILEIQVNRSGHCYMELIEKSGTDEKIIARSRATIWSYKYRILRPYFETTTRSQLHAGIKVLVKAEVSFHELYGLSLNITDIDPSFTLGDLEMKKREVIKKLTADGVMEMNKELILPEVPQNIAVISAKTAAGYGDFIDSLLNNSYNFRFNITLYPAIMQGDAAERSIISALESIFKKEEMYDAVIVIRGGGSQADLECFNSYNLALNIAQFPVPVITGIGHERDETIADLVAHTSLKTPTAVAEFLVDLMVRFADLLNHLREAINKSATWILQRQELLIAQKASDLSHLIKSSLTQEEHALETLYGRLKSGAGTGNMKVSNHLKSYSQRIKYAWNSFSKQQEFELAALNKRKTRSTREMIMQQKRHLGSIEKNIELTDPAKVLERGYSISYIDGEAIKSAKNVKNGDKLLTKLSKGEIHSIITKNGK
ncbi:MAG: exodeoxyribonuclease VII large subunit [Bacteroidales bacterium]|nr:exodeoxyribonuclease VII large subunit [Bacteroidales bacterium]